MDVDALRIAAGLKPLPLAKPAPTVKERGHARGTTDDRRIQDKGLRGIPCVGAGPGVIEGTRPGDSTKDLEQAERDIRIANATLAAAKAAKLRQVRDELRKGKA